MTVLRSWWRLGLLTVTLLASLATADRASAQSSDAWSYVITPQVWASHISKNGFVAPGTLGAAAILNTNDFRAENSQPTNSIDPQWGLQIGAQKGRWSLAGAFQYVSFETRSDIIFAPANGRSEPLFFTILEPGERPAQEFVNTTRLDMDFAVSYLIPDVVPNRLDLSLGVGVKIIYASASRQHGNLSREGREIAAIPGFFNAGQSGGGLYTVCERDDCSDIHIKDRVKTKSLLYGATFPMGASFHLNREATWLSGVSVTPFVGAETRDDQGVVYSTTPGPRFALPVPNRLDGTTFAYGVTGDVTLRHILTDSLSIYGGARIQYIKGHETFLAYGPLFGMSVRFGGK